VETWAEVRRLHRVEGVSQRAIARRLGINRETVATALRRDGPPTYRRPPRGSKVDAFADAIAALLVTYPELSAVRVFEKIAAEGYAGGLSTLRAHLRAVRPRPTAFQRTEYGPGEVGQVDWLELPRRVPDPFGEPRRVYALLLTLGYSRLLTASFSFGMALPDLLRCLSEALAFVGGVPKTLVFDNPKTIVLSHRGRDVVWNPGFLGFADRYGFRPHACTPGPTGAHEKGLVERPVRYLKGNFCAGRDFAGLADVAGQFAAWRDGVANTRLHTVLRERPLDRFAREHDRLRPLPAEPHPGVEVRFGRVTRQGFVRVETSDYTVPAVLAGQHVEVHLGADRVRLLSGGRVVADHARSLGRYRLVEDPAHRARPWAVGAPKCLTPLPPLPAKAHVLVEVPDLGRYAALAGAGGGA
jgi:transposase